MRRTEKERLLSRAVEGVADPDDKTRLVELLAADPALREAYEEARTGHQALLDAGTEPMSEQLREEIRRAVERESRAQTHPAARSLAGRFGVWAATILGNLVSKTEVVLPRGSMAAPARLKMIPVAAGVLFAGVLAIAIWQLIPESVSARRSIAVMGFRNETGESEFDYLQETIPNLLIASLEQSGSFQVTTMERFNDLVRQAGGDAGKPLLDEKTAFEVCRREGIEAIAVGSYTRMGDTFVVQVRILETASGQSLKAAQSRGEGPASILENQVDAISRAVTRGVGDPSLMTERPPSRVVEATTTSLEAYNLYLRGRDELERYLYADARRSLEQAVAIDSTFAVAHLYLADACGSLREYAALEAAVKKAKRFAAKATERESLYIEAGYASAIENDGEKRYRILRNLVEKYPAEKRAYLYLGGYYSSHDLPAEALAALQKAVALDPGFGPAINQIAYTYLRLGQYEEALAYFERYASIQPGDPNPIDSIAELNLRMGRLEESAAKYREVLAVHPDYLTSWSALAYVSALQEDYAEVYRCVEEFTARAQSAGKEAEGRWLQAYYDYLLGRWDRSLDEYRSLRSDMAGVPYFVAATDYILGYLYADRGEYDLALEAFDAWASFLESVDPSNTAYNLVARALTHCHVDLMRGRLDDARKSLAEIERFLPGIRGPEYEFKTFLFHFFSAEEALSRDSIDDAVSFAERMVPRIPSMNTPAVVAANSPLLGDVLARAYWKKGDLDRAVEEFERLTWQASASPDRPSLRLIHPLYHYRLGRVLEEKGDWSRARAEYEKFLEFWKDADTRHPELADARKRLAERPPGS